MTERKKLKQIEKEKNSYLLDIKILNDKGHVYASGAYLKKVCDEMEWLIARVRKLEAALEFYANKNSWFSAGLEGDSVEYNADMGTKAGKALKESDEEP